MSFLNPSNLLNQFGVPNYIQNGNFEAYDTFAAQVAGATKWNAYKDAAQATPVDGTGGTPTVIRNASVGSGSQLRGTRSWQITKTGNAQGEGYSQDFTIDPADKGQLISISFDFSAGSAYTTGDLGVFIYDITNSTLITPSVVNIPSGNGLFTSTFVATTSTSYRIIFHCAASNATTTDWSVTIDNIQVSKNEVVTGAAVTDWQSYTPVLFGSTNLLQFTNYTATGWWRRVGDSAEIAIDLSFSGAPATGTGTFRLSLPSGLAVDTTKVTTGVTRGGVGTLFDASTSEIFNFTNINNTESFGSSGSSSIGFSRSPNPSGASLSFNPTTPITIASGDTFRLFHRVPIANWSSNITLANTQTEYAFNTSTTDADDTTSFGYGIAGTVVPTITAATGSPERRTKRVRFQTPIQPTDVITIEFQVSATGPWTPVGISASYSSFMSQGASEYGIGFRAVSGSTTDIDVDFWKAGRLANNATYAGAGASYPENPSDRWRVRKSAGPNPLQLSGAIVGTQTNNNALAGYVGEAVRAVVSTFTNITATSNFQNITSISLTPGDWDVSGIATFNLNGATMTGAVLAISTFSGNVGTDHVEGDNEAPILPPTGAVNSTASIPTYRISLAATTTIYLKAAATFTAGTPRYKGRISARRVR